MAIINLLAALMFMPSFSFAGIAAIGSSTQTAVYTDSGRYLNLRCLASDGVTYESCANATGVTGSGTAGKIVKWVSGGSALGDSNWTESLGNLTSTGSISASSGVFSGYVQASSFNATTGFQINNTAVIDVNRNINGVNITASQLVSASSVTATNAITAAFFFGNGAGLTNVSVDLSTIGIALTNIGIATASLRTDLNTGFSNVATDTTTLGTRLTDVGAATATLRTDLTNEAALRASADNTIGGSTSTLSASTVTLRADLTTETNARITTDALIGSATNYLAATKLSTNTAISFTGPGQFITVQSSVNASAFFGDGSQLTGITTVIDHTTGTITSGKFGDNRVQISTAALFPGGSWLPAQLPSTAAYSDKANVFTAQNTFGTGTTISSITAGGLFELTPGSTIAFNGTVSLSTTATAALQDPTNPSFQINQSGVITSSTNYRARVVAGSAQALSNGISTPIFFAADDADVGNMHSTSVASDTLTIPLDGTGWYSLTCAVQWPASATGIRITALFVNGVERGRQSQAAVAASGFGVGVATAVQIGGGETVKCNATQNSGASAPTSGPSVLQTVLTVTKMW